jgi:hypothetical protein
MENVKVKEFLVKNKKEIYIGSGLAFLGGVSYAVFGYKGKDGETVFGRYKRKRDEQKIVDAVKSNVQTVKDLVKGKGILAERV